MSDIVAAAGEEEEKEDEEPQVRLEIVPRMAALLMRRAEKGATASRRGSKMKPAAVTLLFIWCNTVPIRIGGTGY